jgi:hypothetical protein
MAQDSSRPPTLLLPLKTQVTRGLRLIHAYAPCPPPDARTPAAVWAYDLPRLVSEKMSWGWISSLGVRYESFTREEVRNIYESLGMPS